MTATLEPLRPVFIKVALKDVGHLDDFDETNMDELDARFRHVLWLVGATYIQSRQMSKRDAIRSLQ